MSAEGKTRGRWLNRLIVVVALIDAYILAWLYARMTGAE